MERSGRWELAQAIAEEVLRSHGDLIHAIGVHGSLAHGDDDEFSDIDLVVVTERPVEALPSVVRRINGVIVDFGVTTAADYLASAKSLTRKWPLDADQYLVTRSIYDPHKWHDRLRETHLEMLKGAKQSEFQSCAREALVTSWATVQKARREVAHAGSPRVVAQYVGSAALEAALTSGLLTRTHYRGTGDALKRNQLDGVNLQTLLGRLTNLEAQLKGAGTPLDGDIHSLFRA